MYIRYLIATALVEIGRVFISEGIDIAGRGSFTIDFELVPGTFIEWFKIIMGAAIVIPAFWIFIVILFTL